jgi:hypothetical protein
MVFSKFFGASKPLRADCLCAQVRYCLKIISILHPISRQERTIAAERGTQIHVAGFCAFPREVAATRDADAFGSQRGTFDPTPLPKFAIFHKKFACFQR